MVQGYHIYMMLTNHIFFYQQRFAGVGIQYFMYYNTTFFNERNKLLKHLINLFGVKP